MCKDLIRGNTGYADNNGIKIWYEDRLANTEERGTLLLIMGIATDALAWHNVFLEPLCAAGYRVIRMDHRDVGMSDWVADFKTKPYTMRDMADDAIAVLDALKIEKAHICGLSMGGMIAQTIAIVHPTRIASLLNIMTSAHVLKPTGFRPTSIYTLARFAWHIARLRRNPTEQNLLNMQYKTFEILMGPYCKDEIPHETITANFNFTYHQRKRYNPKALAQHFAMIKADGSRETALRNLTLPTLIIHGTADPLVPIQHGYHLAKLMPHATVFWVKGMGHLISPAFNTPIVSRIIAHLEANCGALSF
jgi:pimeloyl-ACP methyl ester carboxylesterase